jgi:hypothetical protein
MHIIQNEPFCNAPRDRLPDDPRPALATLIGAMERLSRPKRVEVARFGRKARAAKLPRIRRLTWAAIAEARRLAQVAQ